MHAIKLASIVCPTSVFGAWSLLLASFASGQICMAKLTSKHRTNKMCLPNIKCLKNLMVTKRASKDRLLKLSHVGKQCFSQFRQALSLDICSENVGLEILGVRFCYETDTLSVVDSGFQRGSFLWFPKPGFQSCLFGQICLKMSIFVGFCLLFSFKGVGKPGPLSLYLPLFNLQPNPSYRQSQTWIRAQLFNLFFF